MGEGHHKTRPTCRSHSQKKTLQLSVFVCFFCLCQTFPVVKCIIASFSSLQWATNLRNHCWLTRRIYPPSSLSLSAWGEGDSFKEHSWYWVFFSLTLKDLNISLLVFSRTLLLSNILIPFQLEESRLAQTDLWDWINRNHLITRCR